MRFWNVFYCAAHTYNNYAALLAMLFLRPLLYQVGYQQIFGLQHVRLHVSHLQLKNATRRLQPENPLQQILISGTQQIGWHD